MNCGYRRTTPDDAGGIAPCGTGPNNSIINTVDTGKYVATGGSNLAAGTIQPRTLGLTLRVDW